MGMISSSKSVIGSSKSVIDDNPSVLGNSSVIGGGGTPPPFTPASDSNLIVWWDTTDATTITDTANAVDTFTPKAGSSSTAFAPSNKPTTNTRTINSLNVFDYNGSNRMELFSFPIPSSGNAMFMMVVAIDASGVDHINDSIMSFDAASEWRCEANNATQFDGMIEMAGSGTSSANFTNGPFGSGDPHIFHVVFDFDNLEYIAYMDGVAEISATAYTTKLTSTGTLGIMVDNTGNFRRVNGASGDIIVTESIDSTTVDNHYDYLATKYAI